jgi:guanosine-3',5'-bis(diphosphate) 3'-pyrophosphohydrolase
MQPIPEHVLAAISFAARKHAGQMRRDGATPYASHPMRVLFILRHVLGVVDVDALAAAALHDVIEDTTADRDAITEHFGATVASYVALLSKDKRLPETEREAVYFRALADAPPLVKLCKLADTLDNLLDVVGLKDAAKRKTIAKARHLLALFEPALAGTHAEAIAQARAQIDAVERTMAPLR